MDSKHRLEDVDQFRGLAIVLMVLANYLAGVAIVPAWLRHAPDIGLTVIDLIAPFFIFAIGLTYGISFRRRLERDGARKTISHFLARFLALIGIGALLSAGEFYFGISTAPVQWGVLQAIGVAGLLAMPLLVLPQGWRWAIGLALLGGYQLALDHFWKATVLGSPHGGLPGALSWSAMLILATALADLYFEGKKGSQKTFLLAVGAVLILGVVLAFWAPVSKNRVSASYVLLSLGASGTLFYGFDLLVERVGVRLPGLSACGRNPLLLYLCHDVLLGVFVLPGLPLWYAQAPAWLVVLQSLGLLAVLTAVALVLDRKRLYFSL
jgi:predicted acyltransferase